MPRLTDQQYLVSRTWLVQLWSESIGSFAELNAVEQWHLHAFFRPSEQLSDQAALAHRAEVSAARSSLPQQAGRASKKLRARIDERSSTVPIAPRRWHKVTRVEAHGVVNPMVDYRRLVRLLAARRTSSRIEAEGPDMR
jgi:hypothetical protein